MHQGLILFLLTDASQIVQASCLPHKDTLVWFYGRFPDVSLEFLFFHELYSAASVDFYIMILTSLVHIFPPPSLGLISSSLAWCLIEDLCISFYQLLDEGSMIVGYSPI